MLKHSSVKRTGEQISLGRLGSLETRLADNLSEIEAAQRLRYEVFCEELSAEPNAAAKSQRRECDAHDPICDHLLVIESSKGKDSKIVGTQRFYLNTATSQNARFHSQSEFDVAALANSHPEIKFMELGRSCILPKYRTKRTMELMWQGTWAYAVENTVGAMIGCASFHGNNPQEIADELQFLQRHASANESWKIMPSTRNSIDIDALVGSDLHDRAIVKKLPPLIKGYLRLGAMFSSHAVPDPAFNTIDIFVVLPVERINRRYINYYGTDASKHRSAP